MKVVFAWTAFLLCGCIGHPAGALFGVWCIHDLAKRFR